MTKTPLFDAALDKILADLVPHTRTCIETGEEFEITAQEIEMLKLLRVPPPTITWWAAMRREGAFLAGYDLFLRPTLNATNAISFYDPATTVPLVTKTHWQSDTFDAMAYNQDAKTDEPFFEQWQRLSNSVPRSALVQHGIKENSDWVTYGMDYKDGYGCYAGIGMEDAIYSDSCGYCQHVLETNFSGYCEFCYDSVMCLRSSRLLFCERCEESVSLTFCLACKNCSDCFGCTNLKNKHFCFLNEQLTEEDYKRHLSNIDLTEARIIAEWKSKIAAVWSRTFRCANHILRAEDELGDDIEDSRSAYGVSIRQSERVYGSYGIVECRDIMWSFYPKGSERCYGCKDTIHSSEATICIACDHCIDIKYSESLIHCEHCFGCIGLKHKRFCLFNKQYTEEEYWRLVDAIKSTMLERGEYGEFFPYSASPFAYNASHAGMLFPLSKEEVTRLGGRWYDAAQVTLNANIEDVSAIPERLADVTDAIVKRRFRCPETGRAFFFTAPQLALHRELGVALPRRHSLIDRIRRTLKTLPPRLYTRTCASCKASVATRIPPAMTAPILCGLCYEQVMIGEKEAPKS